jgi:hypothetical protein
VGNNVTVTYFGFNAVIQWTPAAGSETSSVIRGNLNQLPVGPNDDSCVAQGQPNTNLTVLDPFLPGGSPPKGFWYIVRGDNLCGHGPLGFQAVNGVPTLARVTSACP